MVRMTRKTVVLAIVCALGVCAPASAAVLPVKTAKQLAKRLAAKQVGARQIVSLHIFAPRRVSDREVRFAYDDRSAANVFCTAVIVVKVPRSASGTETAKAAFEKTACRGIPDEALAYEAATRTAVRDVAAQAGSVRGALKALQRSSAPCKRLRVPANRRVAVALLSAAAEGTATFGPIELQLQAFVNALGTVRTADGVLVSGAAAWADVLEVFRSLPGLQPSLCGAVKHWAANHWAANAAPVDLAALRALNARSLRDERAIDRAGAHLAALGVFPRTAVAFTPSGLIALGVGIR
jgi:hypothetical protein